VGRKDKRCCYSGALAVGESMFPFINGFENDYDVIAPSYALSLNMTGLCHGLAQILEAEGVKQAHVLGGSYGGLVAQYLRKRLCLTTRIPARNKIKQIARSTQRTSRSLKTTVAFEEDED